MIRLFYRAKECSEPNTFTARVDRGRIYLRCVVRRTDVSQPVHLDLPCEVMSRESKSTAFGKNPIGPWLLINRGDTWEVEHAPVICESLLLVDVPSDVGFEWITAKP